MTNSLWAVMTYLLGHGCTCKHNQRPEDRQAEERQRDRQSVREGRETTCPPSSPSSCCCTPLCCLHHNIQPSPCAASHSRPPHLEQVHVEIALQVAGGLLQRGVHRWCQQSRTAASGRAWLCLTTRPFDTSIYAAHMHAAPDGRLDRRVAVLHIGWQPVAHLSRALHGQPHHGPTVHCAGL